MSSSDIDRVTSDVILVIWYEKNQSNTSQVRKYKKVFRLKLIVIRLFTLASFIFCNWSYILWIPTLGVSRININILSKEPVISIWALFKTCSDHFVDDAWEFEFCFIISRVRIHGYLFPPNCTYSCWQQFTSHLTRFWSYMNTANLWDDLAKNYWLRKWHMETPKIAY